MTIEVFVRSFSIPVDLEAAREASSHTYCAPTTAAAFNKQLSSKSRGRILSSEDQQVAALLGQLSEKIHDEIKLYDVSGLADKVRALKRGIRKTPTVVIDRKKYEGIETISALLSSPRPPST